MIPFNHDLFGGSETPLFRLTEVTPVSAPVAYDPGASPDALLLKSADAPDEPQAVDLPVGAKGRVLYVLTACQGPLDAKDIVATGEVRYADGRVQPLKWMVGEQAWPAWAGASGRGADPVPLGVNPSGDVITASLLTVDLAFPDVAIETLHVESRPGPLSFAILGFSVDGAQTVQLAPAPPTPTYPFRVDAFPGDPPARTIAPVSAKGGHLVRPDGTRARFWGVNLVGPAALPDPADAEAYARHLADAGFDLARLHHLDMGGEVSLLNPKRGDPGEPVALPAMLDRLDRFHAALKAEGIAEYLETWTARSFRPEEGLPSPQGLAVGHKYVSLFEPEYLEAKKAWVRAVWGRTNPYTGLRYADDPAVAIVEISNEDSLLVAWAGGALEKLPGAHRQRLDTLWNAWLRKKYGKDERIVAAWKGTRGGLQPGETLALDSIAREPTHRNRTDLWPTQRAADLVAFYGELEAAHQAEMARFLREEMGFRAPLVCNTSFGVPLADTLLAACDVVDLHVYFDPAPEQTAFSDASLVADPLQQRILEKLAWCQEGKPCTMSELNQPWPGRFSHEAPLVWAALTARQDLDAVLWFAWSHSGWDPKSDGPVGTLDVQGRLDFLAQLPAAGALYRAIEAPARRYVRWWSEDGLVRDLVEPPGLMVLPQVAWRSFLDAVVRTSFTKRPTPSTAAPVSASPIAWDPDAHAFAVDTPAVQAIVGRAAGTSRLRVATDQWVSASLAGDLLTVVGRSERAGTLRADGGPGLLAWGKGPIGLERLTGTVSVKTGGRPEAWVLDGRGEPTRRVAVEREKGGWWAIRLDGIETPWIAIR